MTKKYNSPMLQIVSISKKDIITTSDPNVILGGTYTGSGNNFCAPGQRGLDDWYEGY